MIGDGVVRRPALEAIGLPYRPYLWMVARQSVLLWMLTRLLVLLVLLRATGDIAIALHPTLATRAFAVAVTPVLVWWDRRRSHELLLHANLGASPGWFWGASLLTACLVDVAAHVVLRPLGASPAP